MGAWIHIVGSLLTRTRAQTTHRVNNSAERWHRKGEKSPYPLPQGSWNWLSRPPWQAPPPPDGRWGPNLRACACAPVFRSQANCPNRRQELLEDGGPRAWEPRPSGRAQACAGVQAWGTRGSVPGGLCRRGEKCRVGHATQHLWRRSSPGTFVTVSS